MVKSNTSTSLRSTLDNAFMNMFAIFLTILPLFTIGMWTHYTFFNDPRDVSALSTVRSGEQPAAFSEPLITISFDDGWESIYSNAAPILSKHNIPTTQYVLPGTIDEHNYMSESQIKSLIRSGHDVGSHTMTHVDITTADRMTLDWQLEESKKQLMRMGVSDGMPFASPGGARDTNALAKIKSVYGSHRTTTDLSDTPDAHINIRDSFNKYDIKALTIRRDSSDQQIKNAIRVARQSNGWVVFAYHQVDTTDSMYGVGPDVLDRHMRLIRESDIKVVTVSDVLKGMREQGSR